jgi:hypothetical protein
VKDPVSHDNVKFAPGEFRLQIVSGERSAILENAKLTSESTVLDLLTAYLPSLNKTGGHFSAAEAGSMGEYPVARTDFTVPDRADGSVLFVDMQDIIVGITIFYAPGEADLWQPTLEAMFDSLAYSSS